MNEKRYTIELSESELWVISTALFEYKQNPINEEHGNVANRVYEAIKKLLTTYVLSE